MSGPLEDIHGMIAGDGPMGDDLVKRMNDVRDFPANTCGASRHAAMIAEALCKGDEYPMLADEKGYCGESIAATVAELWECRTKLAKAEKAADSTEAQLAAREWRPIETAPRDGTGFLGFVRQDWIEGFAFWGDELCWLSDGDGPKFARDYPTHWMPWPEPPKAAEKGTRNE